MRNQTSFRLTTTLLPTDTSAKTTDVINKVDSCGCKFKPTFTEETVVLTNDDRTVMETTRAYSCNGAICFTKRGLSDDVSETEVANRKLTWNPGSLAFVTAGAGDFVDKDDNITWTGNQTYTGTLTSTCCATYCGDATYKGMLTTEKGVKYPNFADVTALQAYASPYAGMFATVDDTGELYRYNAVTCCWDMVSSVALGTYEIRCSATRPDSCTGSTIVTMSPEQNEIYIGTKGVVVNNCVDVLLVGGGGGGGYPQLSGGVCSSKGAGGGGGGGVMNCRTYPVGDKSYCVKVGAGGTGAASGCNQGGNGGASSFGGLYVAGGGGGGSYCGKQGGVGANGGGSGSGPDSTVAGICGYGTASMIGHYGGPGTCFSSGQTGGLGHGGQGGSACANGAADTGVNKSTYFEIGGCVMYVSEGGGGSRGNPGWAGTAGASSSYCGGGGGGGIGNGSCVVAPGDGKKGIVMVAYPTDGSYGFTCATGGTKSSCTAADGKTYCIHTFTSNGTFAIVS